MGLVAFRLVELGIGRRTSLGLANSGGQLLVVDRQVHTDKQPDVGLARGRPGVMALVFSMS